MRNMMLALAILVLVSACGQKHTPLETKLSGNGNNTTIDLWSDGEYTLKTLSTTVAGTYQFAPDPGDTQNVNGTFGFTPAKGEGSAYTCKSKDDNQNGRTLSCDAAGAAMNGDYSEQIL